MRSFDETNFNTRTHLRITVVPQQWPACRRYAWWNSLHPDVIEHFPYIGAVRDERDDSHLPAADGAK
jgi:hypothetical protein